MHGQKALVNFKDAFVCVHVPTLVFTEPCSVHPEFAKFWLSLSQRQIPISTISVNDRWGFERDDIIRRMPIAAVRWKFSVSCVKCVALVARLARLRCKNCGLACNACTYMYVRKYMLFGDLSTINLKLFFQLILVACSSILRGDGGGHL